MIVDSHQHVMLPTSMQIKKMDDAGVDKVILQQHLMLRGPNPRH
jgi:predicted metal-dependent TIM-barrel fold hydrolase